MKNKLLTVIFGAVLVLGACGGGNKTTDKGTGTTAGVDADKVFQASCASCHGGNLEGRGTAPSLANIGSELSEAEIHDIIEHGQNGMPGGLIKGEELDAVAKWLSEKK
ncbi:cytochrome c551 [Sporosarcina highlanderae]|uniref:Cytochrome c n=1 Tax=Sporosarcina highlanderae TaxID=3035916 RepID=A0ABT8JNW4_9BACL|nr:cytochrome c [Sporosarcina highlanderae]MDN4606833.1 cytochrome c [Sporosarcina highlanderae]